MALVVLQEEFEVWDSQGDGEGEMEVAQLFFYIGSVEGEAVEPGAFHLTSLLAVDLEVRSTMEDCELEVADDVVDIAIARQGVGLGE